MGTAMHDSPRMNDTKFTSTAKQHKNGDISYAVYADGVEIGSRKTSKRTGFKFAVVCRRNYANSVAQAKESVRYAIAELAKYEGYMTNPQVTIAAEKTAWMRENLIKWTQDGTCAKWIADLKTRIPLDEANLALRLSQTQDSPDFQKWTVVSFSNTGKDACREWMFDMRFIPLTQPTAQA